APPVRAVGRSAAVPGAVVRPRGLFRVLTGRESTHECPPSAMTRVSSPGRRGPGAALGATG
ncbi:hypothetical protein, partial [uncultured Microbacterium sp.]|uniref:hypothetical protein n=1 Tax=uncultured Microbacterium sp. TaxID=191216 RepID=UPI0028D0AAEB